MPLLGLAFFLGGGGDWGEGGGYMGGGGRGREGAPLVNGIVNE